MINKSLVLSKNCKPVIILFEDDNFTMTLSPPPLEIPEIFYFIS